MITVFVLDLSVKQEKLEARGIVPDYLPQCPLERLFAAYRRVRVAFDRRLVHRHHHSTWLALHFWNRRLRSKKGGEEAGNQIKQSGSQSPL